MYGINMPLNLGMHSAIKTIFRLPLNLVTLHVRFVEPGSDREIFLYRVKIDEL